MMTPINRLGEISDELYQILKADKRADTYVIPQRVMNIIAEYHAQHINKQIIEARMDERIMQGEENNSENYRKARLTQLRTTK